MLDLLRARLNRLALLDGLGSTAGHVPGGPGGLSAALLELVAVGLALGLAASSAALGEGRLTLFLRLRLLGPDGLCGELASLGEHGGDLLGDGLLGEGGVVQSREAGEPGGTGPGRDGAQDLGLVCFGQAR
ncbi:hypothetical protein [Kitasatospora sp. NPDC001095]